MEATLQHSAWRLLAALLAVGFLAAVPNCGTAFGAQTEKTDAFSEVGVEWGGYLRAIGTISWLDEDSVYQFVDDDPYFDGQLEGRLKNRIDFGKRWSMETHYELVALGGDTYENTLELGTLPPVLSEISVAEQIVDDNPPPVGPDPSPHRKGALSRLPQAGPPQRLLFCRLGAACAWAARP